MNLRYENCLTNFILSYMYALQTMYHFLKMAEGGEGVLGMF